MKQSINGIQTESVCKIRKQVKLGRPLLVTEIMKEDKAGSRRTQKPYNFVETADNFSS